MSRMTKESLEAKIKKAEKKVVRTGNVYNAACEELKEAIEFFESDMKPVEARRPVKRRGGRRKKKTT